MNVINTVISDVLILELKIFRDSRGFFFESWNQRFFDQAVGRHVTFVQDNHSCSRKGILCGLHYQIKCIQRNLAAKDAAGKSFTTVPYF